MKLMDYLQAGVQAQASDIFIVPGAPVSLKLEGVLVPLAEEKIMPAGGETLIRELYQAAERELSHFVGRWDDDFSFAVPGLARFRVNVYRQRGSWAAVIRIVSFSIPDWRALHIPEAVMDLADLSSGMVLFSGTAGSGKSTTQACLVDRINRQRACHIVTLEDPIEYLHRNRKSIVSQREIAVDTADYLSALRACLRQSPDVIQLGEMRDAETARTAMTAAETGHLLFATLHTRGAVNTIDRIIDTFPPDQQEQIRLQLSCVLQTVVSQQLIPGMDGELIPAFEILQMTGAVRSMIREHKTHQIAGAIAGGREEGMRSMDQSVLELYRKGAIARETALKYAENPEQMLRRLNG